jgi:hypothetical protein
MSDQPKRPRKPPHPKKTGKGTGPAKSARDERVEKKKDSDASEPSRSLVKVGRGVVPRSGSIVSKLTAAEFQGLADVPAEAWEAAEDGKNSQP